VDWLRVLAVLVLFPFHAAQIFNEAPFYVKDVSTSLVIMGLSDFIYQWHMPLFMFLAGIGSYYALRFRSGKEYLLERLKRLLVPLIFGTLVLIPLVTYIRMFGDPEKVWHSGFSQNAISGFDKGFLEYYPDFFNGIYPNGNFEWGHLWFLAYLFTFSLIALPVFLYLKSEKGSWVIEFLKKVVQKQGGIFLFFIPVALIEVLLRHAYPNMQNLISDWANFLMFITVFIFGYIIASDNKFGEAIDRHWKTALTIGLFIAIALSILYAAKIHTGLNESADYILGMILRGVCIWFCLIGFLGFGKRFLHRGGRLINYAREAALPVYVLHLPIIVIVGFYLTRLDWSTLAKYLFITILSFAFTVLLYEIVVRRLNVMRLFLGLKKSG
jgi:hypothetical protein